MNKFVKQIVPIAVPANKILISLGQCTRKFIWFDDQEHKESEVQMNGTSTLFPRFSPSHFHLLPNIEKCHLMHSLQIITCKGILQVFQIVTQDSDKGITVLLA